MGIHNTEKPMFPTEFIWPTKMSHIATDVRRTLSVFPQYAAQASPDPSVKRRKCPIMAVFEILSVQQSKFM